ncbi:unnamed protein product [Urochloa humidicola]
MDADRDGFVNLAEFVTFNSAATAGSRRRGGRGAATRRPRCRRHCACTTRGTSTTSSDVVVLGTSYLDPGIKHCIAMDPGGAKACYHHSRWPQLRETCGLQSHDLCLSC